MKLDKLKVTQKYSSIIPNAETEQAQRDARLGQTVYISPPDKRYCLLIESSLVMNR